MPDNSVEFEGTIAFAPASSRYTLSLQNDKLRISLEDRDSKEKWATPELFQTDYVNSSNAIADATTRDYVELFRSLLEGGEAANEISRIFQRIKDNVFRLELSLRILLQPRKIARYSFDLEPIAVERIDQLESRMCDLRDELKAANATVSGLQTKVQELEEAVYSPLVIQAEATGKVKNCNIICWQKVDMGQNINGEDGIVRGLKPGVYLVMLSVGTMDDTGDITLRKNGKLILDMCGCEQCNAFTSCVTRVEEGDLITVDCFEELDNSSYLTLIRLGN